MSSTVAPSSSGGIPAGMESDDEHDGESFADEMLERRSVDDVESMMDNGKAIDRENGKQAVPKTTPRSFKNLKKTSKPRMFQMKKEKIVQNNDVDCILESVDCSEYSSLFFEQKIDVPQFLALCDADFEKLGIQELGIRKKLLHAIKEIHRRPWHENSLIWPKADVLTCIDATQIISNIHSHVACMESSLMYLRRRYLTDSSNDPCQVTDVDKENLQKLLVEVDDTAKSVENFQKEMKLTAAHMKQLKIDPRTGAVEKISEGKHDENNSSNLLKLVFLGASVVGCYMFWKSTIKHMKFGSN